MQTSVYSSFAASLEEGSVLFWETTKRITVDVTRQCY